MKRGAEERIGGGGAASAGSAAKMMVRIPAAALLHKFPTGDEDEPLEGDEARRRGSAVKIKKESDRSGVFIAP
jgi:hypothetical protein